MFVAGDKIFPLGDDCKFNGQILFWPPLFSIEILFWPLGSTIVAVVGEIIVEENNDEESFRIFY